MAEDGAGVDSRRETAEFDLAFCAPAPRNASPYMIDRIEDFVRSTTPDHYHVLRIGSDPWHAHQLLSGGDTTEDGFR